MNHTVVVSQQNGIDLRGAFARTLIAQSKGGYPTWKLSVDNEREFDWMPSP